MTVSKKQPYRRGRRKCIFCEQYGSSKEHIFPDWLRSQFPRDEDSTHTFGTHAPSQIIGVPRTTQKKLQGHSGTKTVKTVCAKCNNGWLSQIEQKAKPILESLIEGDRINLGVGEQLTLATWATKTVMIAEQLHPRIDGITQAERTWLMRKIVPLDTWVVWLAGYSGDAWRHLAMAQRRGRLRFTPVSDPAIESHYIHATAWGMGCVLFLVVGTTLKSVPEFFNNYDGSGLFRIWAPLPRTILFPPLVMLGDPEANALINILSLSGAFDHSVDPLANWNLTM